MLIEIDKRFTAREIYDIGVGHGKTLVRNVYAAMLYYLKGFAETVADKLSCVCVLAEGKAVHDPRFNRLA